MDVSRQGIPGPSVTQNSTVRHHCATLSGSRAQNTTQHTVLYCLCSNSNEILASTEVLC